MKQQKLQQQNKALQQKIKAQKYEIQNLKNTNQQHENQIETLLKFNERLLTIIETELNTQNSRKSQRSFSLQPISEITERDSEVVDYGGTVGAGGAVRSSSIYLKINDLDKQKQPSRKQSGNVTDRVILGHGLQDQLSYQVSRSDYQKQYSEYSQRAKYHEVISLINAYKMQYGETIKQVQQMKQKITTNNIINNQYMQKINQKNTEFYNCKIQEIQSLKKQISENTPQKQLLNILKSNQYSVNTQNKLMKIMNSIQ